MAEKIILERIQKVFGNVNSDHLPEAILLLNEGFRGTNFNYITGMSQGVFENCGVLFDRGGKIRIFTTSLEEEILRGIGAYADFVVYRNREQRKDRLKEVLQGYPTVGICYESVPHSLYLALKEMAQGAELIDVSRAFQAARMIKLPDEIERIRKACSIVSGIADEIPGVLKEGVTELDLAAEIDYRVVKMGAERTAFKTIVSFGKNTSKPHYEGGAVPLKEGDVVLVDFGALCGGYASDITRTYLTGKPETEVRGLYATVLESQQIALGRIGSGVRIEDVEEEVKRYIDSHEHYRGRFIHSLGHSLGLDVHDSTYPSEDFDRRFAENMVLTVEPGIYIPGFYGVRIEDDILVERSSCSLLTTARKELRSYEI